jgi:hypothetical protein
MTRSWQALDRRLAVVHRVLTSVFPHPKVLLRDPFEHMIEHMSAEAMPDWYAAACRRAAASARSRRAGSDGDAAAWPVFVPPVGLAEGALGAVQAADREIAWQTARRAQAVAEFAAGRPASMDRAQGEPGAMSAERCPHYPHKSSLSRCRSPRPLPRPCSNAP